MKIQRSSFTTISKQHTRRGYLQPTALVWFASNPIESKGECDMGGYI